MTAISGSTQTDAAQRVTQEAEVSQQAEVPNAAPATGHSAESTFAAGSSGTVTVGDQSFQVGSDGSVSSNGAVVGSFNPSDGSYLVNGVPGNIAGLIGRADVTIALANSTGEAEPPPSRSESSAAASGSQTPGTMTGTVQYDGVTYNIINNKVYRADGSSSDAIGDIDEGGKFKVKINGKDETGDVSQLRNAKVVIEKSDGTSLKVDSRGLGPNEDIDPMGNTIRWHLNEAGQRDGFQVVSYWPGNETSSGATSVGYKLDSRNPENNRKYFSDGSEEWWDGRSPPFADTKTAQQLPGETLDTLDVTRFSSRAELQLTLQRFIQQDELQPDKAASGSARRTASGKIAQFDRYDVSAQFDKMLDDGLAQGDVQQNANSVADQLYDRFANNRAGINKDLAAGTLTADAAEKLLKANEAKFQQTNTTLRTAQSRAEAKAIFDIDALSGKDRASLDRYAATVGAYGITLDFSDPNGARLAANAARTGIGNDPAFAALLKTAATETNAAYMMKYNRMPSPAELKMALPANPFSIELNNQTWKERSQRLQDGRYFEDVALATKKLRANGLIPS